MSNQTVLRISKEIVQIQQGSDLSIAVSCQESDVRNARSLIIGPSGTPYEFGFFEFNVKFGNEYPSKPPKVEAKTTNHGKCRFNPNIYAQGKVCLSILGTWRGETSGEEWSSAQGLESILWSIQSLMSSNPYENEPGYDKADSEEDKKAQKAYVAKIRHETIRIAVVQKMEEILGIAPDGTVQSDTPEWEDESEYSDDFGEKEQREFLPDVNTTKFQPFSDLYKRRFLWYYETYMNTAEACIKESPDGQKFEMMPFEHSSNVMDGNFNYSNLITRLLRIKTVLSEEVTRWTFFGVSATARETSTSAKLQRQFEQLIEHQKLTKVFNLTMEMEAKNPFVWVITYFGAPMTHLDGGIFRIKVFISPKFPDEQPRVMVETPIYHHRVSKEGVLCYFPKKLEDMQNHIETMIEALEEESPPFDPRTIVRPEATKLLWGSADEKKRYYRMLRRSAEASTEY